MTKWKRGDLVATAKHGFGRVETGMVNSDGTIFLFIGGARPGTVLVKPADMEAPDKVLGAICWTMPDGGLFPVELHQSGRNRFSVAYGVGIKGPGLSYGNACEALGAAILHSLACDGLIDNG